MNEKQLFDLNYKIECDDEEICNGIVYNQDKLILIAKGNETVSEGKIIIGESKPKSPK